MMHRPLFTLCVAVCAALPAFAAELEFSAGGEVEYDNNVFRSEDDTEDDVLFRLRPGVRIFEDRGDDLNFSASYEAPVELSIDHPSDINDVDHLGNGRFNYHVNDRIEIFAQDQYGYLRSTVRDRSDFGGSNDALRVNDERDRIKVNDGSLGGLYRFSTRTVARAQANTSFFDSSRDDRARVWSVGGTGDLTHALTVKHQVGAGLGYTYQDFSERQDIEGSRTNTYQVYGSWRWLIDPTLSFEVRAGPAYLTTDQEDAAQFRSEAQFPNPIVAPPVVFVSRTQDCPVINTSFGPQPVASTGCLLSVALTSPGDDAAINQVLGNSIDVENVDSQGESDETVTGFVDAVLTKQWLPTFDTALRYTREQGDASGLGGTVITDAVSLSGNWDFMERWSVTLRGDFIRRESAFQIAQTFDQVGDFTLPGGAVVAARTGLAFNSEQDVEIDTNRYGAAVRITHRLFRTTSLYGQVRYDRQDSNSSSLGADSDFENILATFGIRHVFEPITLW